MDIVLFTCVQRQILMGGGGGCGRGRGVDESVMVGMMGVGMESQHEASKKKHPKQMDLLLSVEPDIVCLGAWL